MPGGIQLNNSYCNQQSVAENFSYPVGVSLTGGDGVWGSWGQLIAATPYDIDLCEVTLREPGNSIAQVINIGVGAAGSEKIIFEQLKAPPKLVGVSGLSLYSNIPCKIRAGSRVAAQVRNQSGTWNGSITITGYSSEIGGEESYSGLDVLGYSSDAGVGITTGSSAKGSYYEIVSRTNKDYFGLYVAQTAMASNNWVLLDVAIGPAGQEVVCVRNVPFWAYNSQGVGYFAAGPYRVQIPAGSRITCRGASSSAATPYFCLYGIY